MANASIFKNPADSLFRPQKRSGLLVSVRNIEEAELVLRQNVEVLDLKEPLAGALGAVSDRVIEQVQRLVKRFAPERRPKLSFALGELVDWDFQRWPCLLDRFALDQIAGFSYVKIGLAGTQQWNDWPFVWSELFAGLPDNIQPVVVGYLDRFPSSTLSNGCCPPIEQLIKFAKEQPQVSMLLLDTHDKQDDLFASIGDQRLHDVIAMAADAKLATAVAGSVKIDMLPRVIQAGASLVGVRGAVCGGDRSGQLSEQKLIDFRQQLEEINRAV